MVIRVQDVIIRISSKKVKVYFNGSSLEFDPEDLVQHGSWFAYETRIQKMVRGALKYARPDYSCDKKVFFDNSTPIRRGSDGNRYGYGPSDEEAWAYLYLK